MSVSARKNRNQRNTTPDFMETKSQLAREHNTHHTHHTSTNRNLKSGMKNNMDTSMHNRSLSARNNRSISPQPKNTSTGKKIKFASEMESLCADLLNNISKLSSCLEIYGILESSSQSQRCLQHNNTLSLYCVTQRRILCVNCLFGMHKHRSHKVVPLKDSMNEVYEDNDKLSGIIEQELKRMQFCSKVAEENTIIIETEMRRALNQLQHEFAEKVDEIKAKYEQAKDMIYRNFTPVLDISKNVHKQIEDFKFKIWDTYTGYTDQKATEDSQIMKQLLFVNIVELCEVRCRTIGKNELEQMGRRGKL